MAELHNAGSFFAGIRRVCARLTDVQVETVNQLLTAASAWPIGWVAYGLATAWHEACFVPQNEWGRGQGRPYGVPGAHHGQIPYGRGLVQLTWDANYEWADQALGLGGALLADFELANRPDIATRILVAGMASGHFTGKKLADFIAARGTHAGFVQARRIIDGQDKAELIALYADRFQDALDLGAWK